MLAFPSNKTGVAAVLGDADPNVKLATGGAGAGVGVGNATATDVPPEVLD